MTKTVAQRLDDGALHMATAAVFARHACYNRVREHEHGITAEACAALTNIDLHLALAVLNGLVATGDVEQAGVLYRLPARRRAA